jgi:N-acetylmuramoyl-L-alanine amidase
MKKLVAPVAAALMLLTASPAFAYTVKPGDTLSQIAVDEHITLNDLVRLNPQIKDPNRIYVNDVIKTTPDVASPPTSTVNTTYSARDLDVMSRIIEAEAGGEPYEGKIAVGKVIMNRVAAHYGSSIEAVVYAPHQFSPVANGMINEPASDDSIRAAKELLSTYKGDPNGALFFYNPAKTSDQWIRTRTVIETIGNHIFSK